ncbi:AraC family transcriptional regulator [Paenibacillus sp. Marseille-P2973]|uniref:AraC family transcriptional regulator n=1 Tax=Paenibacillus sp. Marseille-P2973 TaxID=1871032 RepID=UPI001B373535|nr:AraC family transcriptional regulator [Paenibacillus sp. Marseille-P2973]MBQ4901174.1 AraC family transcriptional regulator [Paenibacillus sp. Marseille-P2973]
MDEWFEKQRREMLRIIKKFTPKDGTHDTEVPGLRLIRSSRLSEPVYSVYEPSLCVVAQGSKVVMLGQEVYQYDPSSYLTASVHLPITGQVVGASNETPYLSLQILFDMNQILDVIQASGDVTRPEREASRGLKVSRVNDTLLDAVLRLLKLVETPRDIPVLAPYTMREIIYRVLQNENSAALMQFAVAGSHAHRIAGVVEKLNREFAQPLRVEELAAEARMSASSLHEHFKQVTGMSPIQFQKQIRLQEARRLLFSGSIDAAEAAFQVGYESPSHFSREYARMFGMPPVRDVRRLRSSIV